MCPITDRAYTAAGCTALTGVEAVSNGVTALRPPEGRNAATVMTWLGALSILMFLGITYLAFDFGVVPGGDQTVVSKIARRVFGTGVFYYGVQVGTMLILVLAVVPAFLIIVLGGVGSLWGAVAAGLMVGLAVGLTGAYASEWSLLSMYLLFIAVVTFRSRGLFGRKSVLDT